MQCSNETEIDSIEHPIVMYIILSVYTFNIVREVLKERARVASLHKYHHLSITAFIVHIVHCTDHFICCELQEDVQYCE